MQTHSKIYIAGNTGMVGSAILRNLEKKGYSDFVFTPWPEYDLTNQAQTEAFFEKERPEYVIDAAAKVGGIIANNTYRAQFIYENLMIQNNIIHAAHKYGVKKLLFLGSSCIYPKMAPQPMKEEYLLTGPLEETNEPYAIAKIAGIKMCESYYRQYGSNFISVMPTNLYGPNDNYDLEKSHVLPALIRKMHLGKCLENGDWEAIKRDLNKRPIENISDQNSEPEILNMLSKYGICKTGSIEDGACEEHSAIKAPQEARVCEERSAIKAPQEARVCEERSDEAASPNKPMADRAETQKNFNMQQEPARRTAPKQPQPVIVRLWGTGQVYREFLHVDDMADACIHLMQNVEAPKLYDEMQQTHINIGTGVDLSIKELADMAREIVGYNGQIEWDTNKPDGTPKKQLDVSLLSKLDWKARIPLKDGIGMVYRTYVAH